MKNTVKQAQIRSKFSHHQQIWILFQVSTKSVNKNTVGGRFEFFLVAKLKMIEIRTIRQ